MLIKYKVELNFDKDFVEILVNELGKYNISVDINDDPENIKIKYFNFKKRLIPPIPRFVLKSNKFNYTSELLLGLQNIETKITRGDDLFPHLSKNIIKLSYNDDMLNDWGIYHLHLGINIGYDGFVERTGPVLFARFDDTNAYLINVMPHNSWTKQEIIKVIHDNWPKSIETSLLKGVIGLSHVQTDDDIKKGRSLGINTFVEIEQGIVYAPIGGGFTGSKTGIDVMISMLHYNDLIEKFQKNVIENGQKYGQMLQNKYSYEGTQLDFKLSLQDGQYYAVEQNTRVAFCLKIS